VFAPTRGDTLGEFCQLAEGTGLQVCRYEKYDEEVWDLHLKVSETPGIGVRALSDRPCPNPEEMYSVLQTLTGRGLLSKNIKGRVLSKVYKM
jgi:hypothetical protein